MKCLNDHVLTETYATTLNDWSRSNQCLDYKEKVSKAIEFCISC